MFRATHAFLALLFFLVSSSVLLGQTGTIQGILVDSSGARIPNAQISATDVDKQIVAREAVTDSEGRFYLRNLLPGTYALKGEASGFRPLDRTGLRLDQNQVMDLGEVTMQVGQTGEAVTVEANAPLVETSTANKSFVVTSRQVTELSLNGRDFQSLMRTLPGVVSNDRSNFRLAFNNTDAFNVNGLRGSMNNVFLDGTINTDVGANDGQYTQISLDAVGEFKMQTSTFNAEYGRNPGVFISINTKSGGRQFHGTAYEFFRNNALDARRPFDTTGTVAKLRFNQYGGNLSGPIWLPGVSPRKDPRLFFFFNYEGTRASRPIGGSFVDLPHPDLLNGDLSRLYRDQPLLTTSGQPTGFKVGQVFRPGTVVREANGRIIGGDPYPGNIIPKSEWAKNAQGFINVLKFFNVAGDPGTPGVPETVRHPYQQNYGFEKDAKVARIDWAISSKMNFFFRWADDSQQETQSLGIFATAPSPIFPQFRAKPGSSWSYNLVNVISPTMTNEFIFGYNHLTQVVDNTQLDNPVWDKDKLGFTYKELYDGVNLRNRFPRFNCGVGSCNYGSAFPSGWLSEGKQFAFTDNFSVTRGSHNMKYGGLFNFNLNGQQPSWTDVPNLNFGSNVENTVDTGTTFANMLLGNYTSVSQSNGRFFGTFKFYGFEWYAQDAWKVSRKLTLEYGMRWSYMGPTFTYGKYLQNYFDPRKYDPSKAVQLDTRPGLRNGSIIPGAGDPFNGLVQEGTNGIPKGFAEHRFNNWGPRFGFAYDVCGDGKTSIRGGGGVFYERIRQNANNFDGLGNPPLSYTPSVYVGNIDNLGPQLVGQGVRFPVGLSTFDSRGQIPTIYSWSLGVQRELPWKMSLDLSYVANQARHLQYRRDINMLPLGYTLQPGVLASVNNTTNALRPYKGFTSITTTEYGAISNYNALQVRLSRRFAQNFTGNFNYTWSKAMSEVDSDTTGIGYAYDRRREYGPASFDRTHIATVDFVYEMPFFSHNSQRAVKTLLGGWQINGIARFWGGPPAGISSNGNAGATVGGIRADYIGGNLYPTTQDRYNYFNVYAFGRPVDGSLGNTGKTVIRLPGINEWDFSLFKNFRVTERTNIQLRWETFNTFNHTQWAAVNTGLNLPNPGMAMQPANKGSFGEVSDTRDPRSMQLALKFLF